MTIDNVAHIVIYCLAVWRISSLFVREAGPFQVFAKIRTLVGIEHDDNGTPWLIPDTFLAQLLGCVWCFSLWIGGGMTILILALPTFALPFATIFAFSGGAVLLDTFIQRSR